MKKAEIVKAAESLNDSQQYALRGALENAEFERQGKGLKRPLRATDCAIKTGYRSNVHASTRRSLATKGLVKPERYLNAQLTSDGFKVAKYLTEQEFAGGIKIESDEAPGIVFNATNLEEYVAFLRNRRKREAEEHVEKVKKAAHLWRGLKLDDAPWDSPRSKAVSTRIKREFRNQHWRNSLDLDLDDLIAIGEGIEQLRKR